MNNVRIQIQKDSSSDSNTAYQVTIFVIENSSLNFIVDYMVAFSDEDRQDLEFDIRRQAGFAYIDENTPSLKEFWEINRLLGLKLYRVFLEPAGNNWSRVTQVGLKRLELDLPEQLWHFPWELLRHPVKGYISNESCPIVRKVHVDNNPQPISESPKLYFLGANPRPLKRPTNWETQYKTLVSQIPIGIEGEKYITVNNWDGESNDQWYVAEQELMKHQPDILHITTHGFIIPNRNYVLCFGSVGEENEVKVDGKDLFGLLLKIKKVKLLIVASCSSGYLYFSNPNYVRRLFSKTDLHAIILFSLDVNIVTIRDAVKYIYNSLWAGNDVSVAVADCRNKLHDQVHSTNSLQWSFIMYIESKSIDPFEKLLALTKAYRNYLPINTDDFDTLLEKITNLSKEVSRLIDTRENPLLHSSAEKSRIEDVNRAIEFVRFAFNDFTTNNHSPEDMNRLRVLRAKFSYSEMKIRQYIKNPHQSNKGEQAITSCEQLFDQVKSQRENYLINKA